MPVPTFPRFSSSQAARRPRKPTLQYDESTPTFSFVSPESSVGHSGRKPGTLEISFIAPFDDLPNVKHPVMSVIEERVRQNSLPKSRKDGAKVCLAIEGGGMRGCVSGGMAAALLDLGLTNVFDGVYGSSAGALNGAYFLAGQSDAMRIYFEDATSSEFVDMRRLFFGGGKPVMSLEYLIDTVVGSREGKALDWEKVVKSPVPLKTLASSLNKRRSVMLWNYGGREDLFKALKASANVPVVAGPPIRLNGDELVDAAIMEPIPFHSAVADGCTHVLVLCTRPENYDVFREADPFKVWWSRRLLPDILCHLHDTNRMHTQAHYHRDVSLLRSYNTSSFSFVPPFPSHTFEAPPTRFDNTDAKVVCQVSFSDAATDSLKQKQQDLSSDVVDTPSDPSSTLLIEVPSRIDFGRQAHILSVATESTTPCVGQLEQNSEKLRDGCRHGYESVMRLFSSVQTPRQPTDLPDCLKIDFQPSSVANMVQQENTTKELVPSGLKDLMQ